MKTRPEIPRDLAPVAGDDRFRVVHATPQGFFVWVDVEMTSARSVVNRLRLRGVRISYAGVLARAAALALSRNRDLHTALVGSWRRLDPGKVRIGLSVADGEGAAPVMRLDAVEDKPLPILCQEIAQRAPEARGDSRRQAKLRRWGRMVPFGWMRRLLQRIAFSSSRFRHLSGALQVTVVPGAER
jgi:hypothetical protein